MTLKFNQVLQGAIAQFRRTGALPGILALGACAHAGVSYIEPTSQPQNIVNDAAKGYLNVAMPVSRVLVQIQAPDAATNNPPVPDVDAEADEGPAQPVDMPMEAGAKKSPKPAKPTGAAAAAENPAKPAKPAKPTGAAAAAKKSNSDENNLTTIVTGSDGSKITFTIVQAESGHTFRVNPENNFLSKNQFAIQKLANTDIPTSVSNQFTDMTVARIQAVASIAGTVLKFALPEEAGAEAKPEASCAPLPYAVIDINDTYQWHGAAGCYAIGLGTDAEPLHAQNTLAVSYFLSAVPAEPGDKSAASPTLPWDKVWPVSACLDVPFTVTSAKTGATIANGVLRVIDPTNIQVLPFPQSGKISMHPICGADFSNSPTDKYQTYFDAMGAVLKAIPDSPKASSAPQTSPKT
jgi:hypothetical protein